MARVTIRYYRRVLVLTATIVTICIGQYALNIQRRSIARIGPGQAVYGTNRPNFPQYLDLDHIPKEPTVKYDGPWNSSFASQSFHYRYDVNCSALVYGDKTEVDRVNAMLDVYRRNNTIPIPSDKYVRSWTNDCKKLKTERTYSTRPRSKEEHEYPIAYIILAHEGAAQVERLLRAIYQPQNVYCLHPDAKAQPDFIATLYSLANCFPNVVIPSKLETIQYRGITRLLADISCMKDLLSQPIKWKYIINLCGQDFPLKTNLEIVRQLKAFKGKNDIEAIIPPPYIAPRTKFKIIFRPGNDLPINTRIRHSPPPYNMTIYFGNAYIAATRLFVEFVINDREAIDLLEWSADTWSPDENYWATLHRHPRAPGGVNITTTSTLVRMMRWGDINDHPPCQGKYVRALCVFGIGYLEYLVTIPHLFANKFHYNYDPVNLQCLEDLLDYRTQFPQTTLRFVKEFPAKHLPWNPNITGN